MIDFDVLTDARYAARMRNTTRAINSGLAPFARFMLIVRQHRWRILKRRPLG